MITSRNHNGIMKHLKWHTFALIPMNFGDVSKERQN